MAFFSIAAACVLALALVVSNAAADASAQQLASPQPSTLDRIKAKGHVQCGSVARPGLAARDANGAWSGLEVDICRAIATAVFGAGADFAYHSYETSADYDMARSGADDVSFLTYAELREQKLTDKSVPGPVVFVESLDLLVPMTAPIKTLPDLVGKGVCFMIASPADNSLEAWFRERHLEYIPNAYQEEGEMYDAYNVQRCQAVAGESTALAAARLDRGINRLNSRFLADHLLSFPIVATTPIEGDARWAAIVAWTIDTLLNADAQETTYRPNGLRAMAIDGVGLALAKDWQSRVVEATGSYAAIFRRSLGADSPLRLDPGLNRPLAEGGILLPPFKQ